MKKSLIFILLIAVFTVNSQNWISFSNSESITPKVNINLSNDTIVDFNVTISGMFETPIDTFNRVNIREHSKMDSVGYPELPIISFLVAIPECNSVNYEVSLLDSIQYDRYNIYPAPAWTLDTLPSGAVAFVEQFAYDSIVYNSDSLLPGHVIELCDKGAIRAQHIIRVNLFPVQFNPVEKELIAYSEFQISLTFNSPSGSLLQNVGIFNEVVGSTVINYESNGLNASVNCGSGSVNSGSWQWITDLSSGYIESPCDYLIITHQYFHDNSTTKSKIEELAQHRADFNGYDVALITTNTIYTYINPLPPIDRHEKINLFIYNTYQLGIANNTYDGKLGYVNLFGDAFLHDGIICIPTHMEDESYTGYDVYYSQVDGDDDYPDLMIGRCSVDSIAEVVNVVNKILGYEPETMASKDDMLYIAGEDLDFGYANMKVALMEIEEMTNDNYHNSWMYHNDYANSGESFYQPEGWTWLEFGDANCAIDWSDGNKFVTYMDHGSVIGWGDDFDFKYNDLDNYSTTPLSFVLSSACLTGAFHNDDQYYDCMAEQFLCYDDDKGAIAFIGASEATTGGYMMQMGSEYYKAHFKHNCFVAGEAMIYVKLKNSHNHGYLNQNNLFGDPAINIEYENAENIKPDLTIKYDQVYTFPENANIGENITITAEVFNLSWVDAIQDFQIRCSYIDPFTEITTEIDTQTLNGLVGYSAEQVQFTWETSTADIPGVYEILVEVDINNSILEMSEINNDYTIDQKLYGYPSGFPLTLQNDINGDLITFDINPNFPGEEIILGENVYSNSGASINSGTNSTFGNTSIGNIYNDNNFYNVFIRRQGFSDFIVIGSLPEISYQIPSIYNFYYGPLIVDMDMDGEEEIIVACGNIQNQYTDIICINNDGSQRWNFNAFTVSFISFAYLSGEEKATLLVGNYQNGDIYYYSEDQNDQLKLSGTAITSFSSGSYIESYLSSIDQSASPHLIISYDPSDGISENQLYNLNVADKTGFSSPDLDVKYPTIMISDLNNDGIREIIYIAQNHAISLLDNQFNLIWSKDFSEQTPLKLASADMNGDGMNDIIIVTHENLVDHFIFVYNYNGDLILKIPIFSNIDDLWVSDIDLDGEVEILYIYESELAVVKVPGAGSSIGWPGQRGNFRNNGIESIPAFFPSTSEISYWADNIILYDDLSLASNSSIIIKPQTTIKCASESQLSNYGSLTSKGTSAHPVKFNALISTNDLDYWSGITLCNNSNSSFDYTEIENAEIGLLYEYNSSNPVKYCTFSNNIVGLGAYTTSPIVKQSHFHENTRGVEAFNSSSPKLADLGFGMGEHYENALINNETNIYLYNSSVHLKNGYNDIYRDDDSGDYIYYSYNTIPVFINAQNNFWNESTKADILTHLHPSSQFIVEPFCLTSQTGYKSSEVISEDLLYEAYTYLSDEEFELAIQAFESIIEDYPFSNEAFIAVSGLYDTYYQKGDSWPACESYYTQIYGDTNHLLSKKLLFSYLNLSLRMQEKYLEAIANYESILQNNPSYNDSVFAVIDIGNTYVEAGNYKTTLGQMHHLIPENQEKHNEKTVDLLLTLHEEEQQANYVLSSEAKLFQNFPNPFSDKTTIEFFIPEKSRATLKINNAFGKEVMKIEETFEKGINTYHLDKQVLANGIYFYALYVESKFIDSKKMIIR